MLDRSLKKLEDEVLDGIARSDLDAALRFIINFVERIIRDHYSIAKVFGSKRLDELCQAIGAEAAKGVETSGESNPGLIVYLATELYNAGGHTALIEDLISAAPDSKHVILLSNLFDGVDLKVVLNRFLLPNVTVESADAGSALDKLKWLQHRLLALRPGKVFLFNHNHDAVAVAAAQPVFFGELVFYHHGDHHLCLGVYLPFGVHIDPHNIGFFNCRDHLGIRHNRYWPLVVKDAGLYRSPNSFRSKQPLVTCSSGRGEKFQITYLYSYVDEVPHILAATGGTHLHIGDLSGEVIGRIRAGLDKLNIDPIRFVLIPWVENLWAAILKHGVDLYIASFPLGGARASIEVMGSGTPIAVHDNYLSRFHGGADLVYPEAFRWRTPSELYAYLGSLDIKELAAQSRCARRYYERHHTFEKLEYVYRDPALRLEPPPLGHYSADALQAYLDGNVSLEERAKERCASLIAEVARQSLDIERLKTQLGDLTTALATQVEQAASVRQLVMRILRLIGEKIWKRRW